MLFLCSKPKTDKDECTKALAETKIGDKFIHRIVLDAINNEDDPFMEEEILNINEYACTVTGIKHNKDNVPYIQFRTSMGIIKTEKFCDFLKEYVKIK